MKICNLNYNSQLQLLVCVEHDLCIASKSLKAHLQRLHEVKGERLHAALVEVAQLQVRDPRQTLAPADSPPILYLSIDTGYRCGYIACNGGKDALSKNRRTMERHLTKVHNIENGKGKTSPACNDLRTICVQSFCTGPNYRPFVVRVEGDRNDEGASISSAVSAEGSTSHAVASSHAVNEVFDPMRVELEQEYERSRRDWESTFERLQSTSNPYADQTPPWLRIIDISRWMTKLHTDKKRLRELLHANTNGEFFFMATSIELQLTACNRCYRTSSTLLGRSSDAS